jgi:cystathionine beta-synthase
VRYAQHISELVGNTPLVELSSIARSVPCTVLAKIEYLNPGGSIKDRIATKIIENAERRGLLKPGGVVVEPTSGNTGVGLAMVALRKGYRCIFVCPDKVSDEKIRTLEAYGAQVVVTPTAVPPEDPESFYSVSNRLLTEIPGAWKPDQYSNPDGPEAHYETTGPEIWRDTNGTVTHVVAGAGTGGTISGVGRYLREVARDRRRGQVRMVLADPVGSIFSGPEVRPYLVEGVGEDFLPAAFDPSVVDETIAVTDAESLAMTRKLAEQEALLVGGSSGMIVTAALRIAQNSPADSVIVAILPDSGRGYLSKVFNDEWMRSHGFLRREGQVTVEEMLREKQTQTQGAQDDIVFALREVTVREAVETMRSAGVSQLPVLTRTPPVRVNEVLGSLSEKSLMRALLDEEVTLDSRIASVMDPPFPLVGVGDTAASVMHALTNRDAVLVTDGGSAAGILTRADALCWKR